MTTTALATTILTFTAIVAVGAVLRATGVLRREDARPINALIIYVGPARLHLPRGARRRAEPEALGSRRGRVDRVRGDGRRSRGWPRGRSSCRARSAGASSSPPRSGNTGYIGYPITQALLGADALPEAIFYDVFGTVGALVFVGLLDRAALRRQRRGARQSRSGSSLTFPAVIALAAALLLRPFPIPDLVSSGLGLLASMVAPLIMLSVGLSLRFSTLGRDAGPLGALALLRLVVAPLDRAGRRHAAARARASRCAWPCCRPACRR